MAVTKAQLVVWTLIAGLSVWGYTALSRVKLPDELVAQAPTARVLAVEPQIAAATPAEPGVVARAALPATVPFPFPDDLVPATVGNIAAVMPQLESSFAGLAEGAIPEISTITDIGPATIQNADSQVVADPAPEPRMVAAMTEEPPIPMPARPVVAQPVKAVPLSEVKTLYVVADTLNVRAAPTTSGPVLQKVPQGFAVAAREQANEWIGFLMRDGSTGWMRTDYLSDTMPVPVPAGASPVRVWTEPLNLMM